MLVSKHSNCVCLASKATDKCINHTAKHKKRNVPEKTPPLKDGGEGGGEGVQET